MTLTATTQDRPVIYQYRAIPPYLRAMLNWRKENEKKFSVRRQCREIPGCSPTLVALVTSGKRRLTRDRVPMFARLLSLPRREELFLDRWVADERSPRARNSAKDSSPSDVRASGEITSRARAALPPHLLSDWLNIYVKDAAGLRGFRADPALIQKQLGGLASQAQIARSLKFLLQHGYLRRSLDGRVVKNEEVLATLGPPPGTKARAFHRKALSIARDGVRRIAADQRHASAVVMSLNEDGVADLRELLEEFYEKLMQFVEDHGGEGESLYQVLLHLTPISLQGEGML